MIKFLDDWWPIILGIFIGCFSGYVLGSIISYYIEILA